MAIDTYVKFGRYKDPQPMIGPHNTYRPKIDGDSTDADHYWWCELRDCGFDLKNPDPPPAGKDDDKDDITPSHFDPVTLRKRVDWATTQLFIKCCQGPEATTKRVDSDESEDGVINEVEVHVCRPVGSFKDVDNAGNTIERVKIPVVIVIYKNVRITHFQISIDDPEPAEEIKFEFDELDYGYQPTNPNTGEKDGDVQWIKTMKNHKLQEKAAPSADTPATTSGSGGGASATVVTAGGGGGAQGGGSNGSSSGLVTTTESIALANVPGLLPLNGQGTWS